MHPKSGLCFSDIGLKRERGGCREDWGENKNSEFYILYTAGNNEVKNKSQEAFLE